MIINVEQINIPQSGIYDEVIYDVPSSWNSQKWTWLKFTNDDYSEWCGEFRGEYKGHGISERDNCIYILTSDYLFLLDIHDGKLLKYEDSPQYQELTVSPKGDCLVASYYHIEVIDSNLDFKFNVEVPISLDMIIFSEWHGNELIIRADEFSNWDNHVAMKLNCESWEVNIISQTSN